MLTAILRLVLTLLRLSGFKLGLARIPDAAGKRSLLSAVSRARESMPLASALRVLGLSVARYHTGREARHRARLMTAQAVLTPSLTA